MDKLSFENIIEMQIEMLKETRKKLIESIKDRKNKNTFKMLGVNHKGDFIRSYKTLEEAKLGAVGRCGWQGINRDTLIRPEKYQGKTAEEIFEEIQ